MDLLASEEWLLLQCDEEREPNEQKVMYITMSER
jgi:hypothetical protein